jgi:membrane protein YdbS with pleckstrin-like domain
MNGPHGASLEVPAALRLNDNERVLAIFNPSPSGLDSILNYILSLGLYEFWRRVTYFVLTDQRCVVRKGLIAFKSEKSLPLFYVQDAEVNTAFWWATVKLSTAGGSHGLSTITPLRNDEAYEMKDKLLVAAKAARLSERRESAAEPTD